MWGRELQREAACKAAMNQTEGDAWARTLAVRNTKDVSREMLQLYQMYGAAAVGDGEDGDRSGAA
jgi:acyl-CoA-binding protein